MVAKLQKNVAVCIRFGIMFLYNHIATFAEFLLQIVCSAKQYGIYANGFTAVYIDLLVVNKYAFISRKAETA